MMAAPLIIATGLPVIAVGGFAGRDPILTPDKLQRLVAARRLRFVMIGNSRGSARMEAEQRDINDWVRAHGRPVDPQLWRLVPGPPREISRPADGGPRGGSPELFDLGDVAAPGDG
jgi:hypothetical protein